MNIAIHGHLHIAFRSMRNAFCVVCIRSHMTVICASHVVVCIRTHSSSNAFVFFYILCLSEPVPFTITRVFEYHARSRGQVVQMRKFTFI